MQKFTQIVGFIYRNRRAIGLIIGSTLTITGFPDIGEYMSKVSQI